MASGVKVASYVFMAGKRHLFWGLICPGSGPGDPRWQSKYLKTNVSVLAIDTHLMTMAMLLLKNKCVRSDYLIALHKQASLHMSRYLNK